MVEPRRTNRSSSEESRVSKAEKSSGGPRLRTDEKRAFWGWLGQELKGGEVMREQRRRKRLCWRAVSVWERADWGFCGVLCASIAGLGGGEPSLLRGQLAHLFNVATTLSSHCSRETAPQALYLTKLLTLTNDAAILFSRRSSTKGRLRVILRDAVFLRSMIVVETQNNSTNGIKMLLCPNS